MPLELADIPAETRAAIAQDVIARLGGMLPGEPLTAEELAKRARLHPATIRRMAKAGRIRRIPGTHRVLIPYSEAKRILEGGEA